jgi:multiple sugar transport system substrate-binding protein
MAQDKNDADLAPFLDELPSSQLYPVGKTSWAAVSADIKKQIGKAVSPDGSPAGILGSLQQTATTRDSAG